MSKKINTTSIGLFIVTGVALGVIGLLLFSSSKMFTKTREVIVYFNESLNGLSQGAPVKYRGVTIGSVKRVMIRSNQATNDYAMPVIIELDSKLLQERMDDPTTFTESALEARIGSGLRATLESESLVTGVLYVEMKIHANAPPPVFHQLEKRYPEVPSMPTQIQQLMNNLASLDVKSIETNVNALIVKLDSKIGSLNMAEISRGTTNLLASINRLVSSPQITNDLAELGAALEQYRLLGEKLNRQVDPLVGSVTNSLDQYRLLGAKLNAKIDPLADSLTNSLAEANRALAQIRGAAENLRILLAPDAPLPNNLDEMLQQIAEAGQSITALVEFLKQHPNALITGRKILETKP
jgi:paraquat-inducible protein B